MKAKQLVDIRIRREMCDLRKKLNCNHVWIKYAGYKCIHCGFVTGGHEKLNLQLENELTINK